MDKKTIGSKSVFFVFHYYYYHYQKESVYWIFSSEYPGELIAPGSHWQGFRDYNQDKRFLKTFYIKI